MSRAVKRCAACGRQRKDAQETFICVMRHQNYYVQQEATLCLRCWQSIESVINRRRSERETRETTVT